MKTGALLFIAKRGSNAALGRNSVRTGWENLGQTGRLEALLSHAHGGAQAGAAGADNNNVIGMVSNWICLAHVA